jgi:hypothetical protein
MNPPGSEVGPGAAGEVATWETAISSNWSNHNQIIKSEDEEDGQIFRLVVKTR